ncbi:MAG: DUF3473 domain-containing protein [Desulfobacteraceae bacterium]|nr:DUF3473 domain-containing protein [Desulfobacteraceae bacterium]
MSEQVMLDAFCVDLEDWFHICAVKTPYENPASWDSADSHIERHTDVLLGLLDEVGAKGTFFGVGWIANKHPRLIQKISDLGHEVGCHGYFHRLVYTQSPKAFREDLTRARKVLQDCSGKEVVTYRAPGFSMKRECFWAYEILAQEGFVIDVSIVPAVRDHGGVRGFFRSPFKLRTMDLGITVFPVSVMSIFGITTPFSGGGYLRLFPISLIKYGCHQIHKRRQPAMIYIHPREVDPNQPRLRLPIKRAFKYYVGLRTTIPKLKHLLRAYHFGTVSEVVKQLPHLPVYNLINNGFDPVEGTLWDIQ